MSLHLYKKNLHASIRAKQSVYKLMELLSVNNVRKLSNLGKHHETKYILKILWLISTAYCIVVNGL